jgi:hypothetical protein
MRRKAPALTIDDHLALITQMSQTAVCNRHHSLDKQLCRCKKWTLPIRDWKASLNRFSIQFEERLPQL